MKAAKSIGLWYTRGVYSFIIHAYDFNADYIAPLRNLMSSKAHLCSIEPTSGMFIPPTNENI